MAFSCDEALKLLHLIDPFDLSNRRCFEFLTHCHQQQLQLQMQQNANTDVVGFSCGRIMSILSQECGMFILRANRTPILQRCGLPVQRRLRRKSCRKFQFLKNNEEALKWRQRVEILHVQMLALRLLAILSEFCVQKTMTAEEWKSKIDEVEEFLRRAFLQKTTMKMLVFFAKKKISQLTNW